MRGWFNIDEFDKLTPFIAAFRPQLQNSLEDEVKESYETMIENWEQGQDATGTPWEPNAPGTLENKSGSTPLIETRQMIDSAGYAVDKDDLTAQIYIDDDEGKVLAHENGVPDMGIPKRPILGPTATLVGQNADGLFKKAFAKSWMTAQASGTALNVGIGGSGRLRGGGR